MKAIFRFSTPLLALAVGGLAVAITLVAPTWVAAIVSGLGGAGVALAVQAGLWLRKHLGTLLATRRESKIRFAPSP